MRHGEKMRRRIVDAYPVCFSDCRVVANYFLAGKRIRLTKKLEIISRLPLTKPSRDGPRRAVSPYATRVYSDKKLGIISRKSPFSP